MRLAALSGTFLDMYCARLAREDGISAQKAAPMFGCFGGKAWVFSNKIYPAAARLDISYLRKTVSVLSETDIRLKSSSADPQTVIEETVVKMFELTLMGIVFSVSGSNSKISNIRSVHQFQHALRLVGVDKEITI